MLTKSPEAIRNILNDPLMHRLISVKMIKTFCDMSVCLRQQLAKGTLLNCDVYLITGTANKVANVEIASAFLKDLKCRDKKSTFYEHGDLNRDA